MTHENNVEAAEIVPFDLHAHSSAAIGALEDFLHEHSGKWPEGHTLQFMLSINLGEKDDPFGLRTEEKARIFSEFLQTLVENSNFGEGIFGPDPKAYKGWVHYERMKDEETGDPLITFTVPAAAKEKFTPWLTELNRQLDLQIESMKDGWHIEFEKTLRGKKKWFVHPPLLQDLSYQPLKPLVELSEMNRGFFYNPKDPRVEHGPLGRASEVRVREDAMDAFLEPAGLTQNDLHIAEPVKRAWRF
jgi:hypothetical protein